jgi:hypothetical protein
MMLPENTRLFVGGMPAGTGAIGPASPFLPVWLPPLLAFVQLTRPSDAANTTSSTNGRQVHWFKLVFLLSVEVHVGKSTDKKINFYTSVP